MKITSIEDLEEYDRLRAEIVQLRERAAFYKGMQHDMSNKQQRIKTLEAALQNIIKHHELMSSGTLRSVTWHIATKALAQDKQ